MGLFRHTRTLRVWLVLAAVAIPASAFAQLRAEVFVSGFTHPLGFIQDPSDPAVQYVPQQEGIVRVVKNGVLQAAPFLDLTGSISTGGERGLLGLAFPPDYGSSGRFYVNFTNPAGATVVARYHRSSTPLVADPASRFDFKWSNGLRTIPQPFANHNGGNLVFGPDGYLYIGMGDGGDANDPFHNAQNPASLLGKMLRIDVSVGDGDAEGFDIPAGNPFAGSVTPEIWDFGMRNPWRFSFDNPALGGTGALIIADVGQGAREEIDYEPAGRGGRNYGWRNREGTLDNVTTLPPAFTPLTDPIFEYDHTVGRSITGGYVYRGTVLSGLFRGRYFFGDFITGRVWSIALTIDPVTGEATASGLIDHTADLGGAPLVASLSSFGVDAAGEIYLVNHAAGTILRIRPDTEPEALLRLELPVSGSRVREPFVVSGWALDPDASAGAGIDQLQVWAVPVAGGSPIFAGAPAAGLPRPDVAAIYGAQFGSAGFGLVAAHIPPGRYYLVAFGRVIASGNFGALDVADVTFEGGGVVAIESPQTNTSVARPFVVRGFALDGAAASGAGVSGLLAFAFPVAGGSPISLGVPAYGLSRPDIAAIVGTQFQNSGFSLTVSTLPPGTYDLAVISRSTVTGTYSAAQVIRVTVQ